METPRVCLSSVRHAVKEEGGVGVENKKWLSTTLPPHFIDQITNGEMT